MGNKLRAWWFAVCGPTIYRVPSASIGQSLEYKPNKMETLPNMIINCTNSFYGFLKWTILLWSPWVLKNVTSSAYLYRCSRFCGCITVIYAIAMLIRGTGRIYNPEYYRFTKLYLSALKQRSDSVVDKLTLYSFSSPWPAQFDVHNLSEVTRRVRHPTPNRDHDIPVVLWPFTWLIAHTIGIRIAYPGSTGILNSLTLQPRLDARDHLRRQYGIRRVGLTTRDGDFVEAFFADRRGSTSTQADVSSSGHGDSKGEIMIICCEGNGGYPEIGTPQVPLELGYSVMAWNHPGFGASTNLPYPVKEQNAIEAVMLFVMHQLHFKPHQIYLFGWSIGGYTATWAAMNYPEISGVILDATFDNLDELARKTVPDVVYPIVLAALHQQMDLNNLAQLTKYDGPIRIIRRSNDEIISTSEPPSRETNRGTYLFVGLMKHRFPHLVTEENEVLLNHYMSLSAAEQRQMLRNMNLSMEQMESLVLKHLRAEVLSRQHEADGAETPAVSVPSTGLFPSSLGSGVSDAGQKWKMLLYLVTQYHAEAPGSHCSPLDRNCFQLPWSPFTSDAYSSNDQPRRTQTPSNESNSDWVMD